MSLTYNTCGSQEGTLAANAELLSKKKVSESIYTALTIEMCRFLPLLSLLPLSPVSVLSAAAAKPKMNQQTQDILDEYQTPCRFSVLAMFVLSLGRVLQDQLMGLEVQHDPNA